MIAAIILLIIGLFLLLIGLAISIDVLIDMNKILKKIDDES